MNQNGFSHTSRGIVHCAWFLIRCSPGWIAGLMVFSLLLAQISSAAPQATIKHTIKTGYGSAQKVQGIDLDQDGDMDVLAASFSENDISWWENDGDENFTMHPVDNAYTGATAIEAADIDGDGDLDLVGAACDLDQVTWWENNASQVFTPHVITNTFNCPMDIFVFDIDLDLDLDVVAAAHLDDDPENKEGDAIAWWANDGEGNFTDPVVDATFDGAHGVWAADVDGDFWPNILGVAHDSGEVAWWGDVFPITGLFLPLLQR